MPIYEYKCKGCGFTFEDFRPADQADGECHCPKCGKPKADRLLSAFATGGKTAVTSGGSCVTKPSGGFR